MKRWSLLALAAIFALAACSQLQPPPSGSETLLSQGSETLVINEVDYDQPGLDTAEFIEIKNVSANAIDLSTYTIELFNGSTNEIYRTVTLPATLLPAGDYFVVCVEAANVPNCDLDAPELQSIQNGPDAVHLLDAGAVVDSLSYEGDVGIVVEGSGASLADTGDGSLSRIPDGTDTDQNDLDFSFQPVTPGAANVGVEDIPVLVIHEIMQNPSAVSDGDGEWFELYNPGSSDVDIEGWTIRDDDTDVHVINSGAPLLVPAGGYLVLGNNGDTSTNGGVDVDYDYGSSFFLANGADELVLEMPDASLVDRVAWDGGPEFPDPAGAAMALSDPTLDNALGGNWCTASTPYGAGDLGTPGAANDCGDGPAPVVIGVCGDPATFIHEIQGAGFDSPLVAADVVIEGVVVGDFQPDDGDPFGTDLGGFYVQEEDADADLDPATSEGIFVFYPGPVDVAEGDVVRVLGTVDEFFGLTEITDVAAILVCDTGATVTPTVLSLPLDDAGREAHEGMLVTFEQDLVISEYFNFDRFGEIVLALPNPDTEDRQFQPTSFVDPGLAAAAEAEENELGRITLDDARSTQNPDPARHPNGAEFDLTNRFRGGDIVSGATGVLDYRFSLYRVQPTTGATYTSTNPRPASHEIVGGTLEVSTFNVLSYFLTLDEGADICGADQNQECRGADDADEFNRQRDKILAALAGMDSDVFGLIELENTPGVEPLADLVDGLNAIVGAGTYDYIDTGVLGPDAIRVGFIYKATTLTPFGDHAVLDTDAFLDPNDTGEARNRPALAQTFQQTDGALFTAVVNHLKSKGSECGPGDDDPQQGSCNLTRTLAAQELADWLASDPTGAGDPDVFILGDLNAYDEEDPIDALASDGFTDLGEAFQGEYAYTYVFNGQFGHLDYAMANPSALPQVTGATNWHINADEPDILDYDTSFKQDAQDALYEPNAFRSSDHDPVIVGLELVVGPICAAAEPSVATLWSPNHEMVGIDILGVTHPADADFDIQITGIFQDEPVNGRGDGNFAPDGEGVGTSTAWLRAERAGSGNGRVYEVSFTATDEFGVSCFGDVQVTVPHDQGRNGAAVDDGTVYDSTETP